MEKRKRKIVPIILICTALILLISSLIFYMSNQNNDENNGYFEVEVLADGRILSKPVLTDEVFTNPGMGWILLDTAVEEFNDAGSSGDYPLVNYVSIMTTWGNLEPEEGKFEWEILDKTIEAWASKGKSIKFRISTDDWPYYTRTFRGVPDWVVDLGVPVTHDYYQEHMLRYPDANNPIYQEKLRNFMTVFADRYADNPHLEMVDLRGYGLWGEWHSGYIYETLEERRSALISIIDIWYEAFDGRVPLALNYSHEWRSLVPGTVRPTALEDYLYYSAFDYALTKDNIHWEREGFYGAMQPYEWEFNEILFDMGKQLVAEIAAGYQDLAMRSLGDGIDHHKRALEECLRSRPNKITIFGWDHIGFADIFYEERADLIEKGLLNMGYRFIVEKAVHKPEITKGSDFDIEIAIKNLAVGRFHEDARFQISLWDKNGSKEYYQFADINLFDVIKENPYEGTVTLNIPTELNGRYLIKVSISDENSNVIKMPMLGRNDDLYHIIGQVIVK